MLTILGKPQGKSNFCDGIPRRDFLTIGGMALCGLTLPQMLRAEAEQGIGRSHKAIINVSCQGGHPTRTCGI